MMSQTACVETDVWVTTCKWCIEVSFKKAHLQVLLHHPQHHPGPWVKLFPSGWGTQTPGFPKCPLPKHLPAAGFSYHAVPDDPILMLPPWCPYGDAPVATPPKWCSYHADVPLMSPLPWCSHHAATSVLHFRMEEHQKVKFLLCQSFRVN